MLGYVIPLCLAMLGAALLLAVARLVKGPSLPDRVLALDTLYINAIALIMVLGIRYSSQMYFEAALVMVLFGFVGSAALAKFLLRGEVIE